MSEHRWTHPGAAEQQAQYQRELIELDVHPMEQEEALLYCRLHVAGFQDLPTPRRLPLLLVRIRQRRLQEMLLVENGIAPNGAVPFAFPEGGDIAKPAIRTAAGAQE